MCNLRQQFTAVLQYVLVPTVLLFVLSTSQPASGTTLMRMSLAQISQAAQVIVRARCIGNSTRWDAGEIWTFTSFAVEETWSGSAPAQISVRLLGGRVGNLTSTVSGVPRFSPGEQVVLFLAPTARGDFSVVSWEQGTFRIRRDVRTGVLAFTRVITANAPGASVGSGSPASFAGQILDADTLFRSDGEATFATPAALATTRGQGAYDLESLLTHEIGHWFGFDHSAVWRAIMFPFAPPPGQFLGDRPTAQAPDGPLSDDDRTGIRMLYPDPNDTVNIGGISGRVIPANPFALATLAAPSPGSFVTGIFGAHVVAVDSDTGAVIAGTLGGWMCDTSTSSLQFRWLVRHRAPACGAQLPDLRRTARGPRTACRLQHRARRYLCVLHDDRLHHSVRRHELQSAHSAGRPVAPLRAA